MARTSATITAIITPRWWLSSYLFGVVCMARMLQCEPNWDRVRYWIGKGIKVKVR